MEKFLTIIIRVYNRADVIKRCLYSVINQTKINDIQILIINDGSTDNILSIINNIVKEYPNININIVSHYKNMGRGKALNTAKKYVKGKYCCILDSDDIYIRNNWVEDLMKEIGNNIYDVMYNGIYDDFHVNNIYLSKCFKECPIPNVNYNEDHYTHWFFNKHKNDFKIYQYNINKFYKIIRDSKDRENNDYKNFSFNYDNYLFNLYKKVFYHEVNNNNINNLIKEFNKLKIDNYDDGMMESYNEIKLELGL